MHRLRELKCESLTVRAEHELRVHDLDVVLLKVETLQRNLQYVSLPTSYSDEEERSRLTFTGFAFGSLSAEGSRES